MAKAILIMEMPTRCGQCPFHYATQDDNCNVVDKCQLLDKEIDGYRKKYSDCPLRDVPQKKTVNGCFYEMGYNACIDEILGGGE